MNTGQIVKVRSTEQSDFYTLVVPAEQACRFTVKVAIQRSNLTFTLWWCLRSRHFTFTEVVVTGKVRVMRKSLIEFYTRLAHGIASQFGSNCEVVVHDLQSNDREHSIIAIENGHVTGRKIGDGPSKIVLESLQNSEKHQEDKLSYLTRTQNGKILKSSTIYIRDDSGKIIGIFGINFDITLMQAMEEQLQNITGTASDSSSDEPIAVNVGDLLDELIEQSVHRVGKPVTLMTKEDKVAVVRFLNEAGAFLITKSGPKVCQYLGISKYTLYSYLDEIKNSEK